MLQEWVRNPKKNLLQPILWDTSMKTFFKSNSSRNEGHSANSVTSLVEALCGLAQLGELKRRETPQLTLEALVDHILDGGRGTGRQTQHIHETRKTARPLRNARHARHQRMSPSYTPHLQTL